MDVQARPYHHGNLRAELLEHAERALRDGGAGALSLRELARRAGVSHAAPRRHFPGKQALLDALAQEGFERIGRELDTALHGAGPTFEERFAAVARAYVRFATDHAALLELMFTGKHRPGAAEELRAASERAFTAPLELILRGQRSGEVVPGEPERVALAAFATLQGLASMASTGMLGEAIPLDDAVTATVERLVLGLQPR